MEAPVLLITPPFTQLNTPYPATAYLKGFFNTKNIATVQADLGIEVTMELFSKHGLEKLFSAIHAKTESTEVIYSRNSLRMIALRDNYIQTIDHVIQFLQGKQNTLAHTFCTRQFLPEAGRFAQMDDLNWAFGSMGKQDRAKHIATMYLEDLGDLIKETVDPHFGFSRYAESLGRSANSFDELYKALQLPYTYLDEILIEIFADRLNKVQPKLVCISVPFPGNLYTSLRCGQWIKKNRPHIKVAMGGGFANTELRSLSDVRVFEFYDFITLDDGEAPLEIECVGMMQAVTDPELEAVVQCWLGLSLSVQPISVHQCHLNFELPQVAHDVYLLAVELVLLNLTFFFSTFSSNQRVKYTRKITIYN